MNLNLFRQDIKKICLLIAFQQSLSSGKKTADFRPLQQILVRNSCHFVAGDLKAFFFYSFALIFFTLTLATILFCKFFATGLKSHHHLQSFVMMKTTV
jgi:hypothetical protein